MSLEVSIKKELSEFCLDIEFQCEKNTLGILGASGGGKSMTLKSIAGIINPDSGRISSYGQILYDSNKKINLPPQKRKIGYLFQNYALFPNMTVMENIMVGFYKSKNKNINKNKIAEELLERFRLNGLADRFPRSLSGGQQQRVALARILAYEPQILLLDEPFSAMDSYLKEELQIELSSVLKAFDGTAIMVTHDRDEVYKLCNELMIVENGKILEKNETRSLFKYPKKYLSARLTGCKNFSDIKIIDDYSLFSIDWGAVFKFKEKIPKETTMIGIRAHDFKPSNKYNINSMEIEILKIIESPFEWNVIFANKNYDTKNPIWWKFGKDIWSSEKNLPSFLSIPEDKILFLH